MTRGEVWWVEFEPPLGRRPAVLISRDRAYRTRAAITVVPLTRTIRGIPVEVLLEPSDGMPRRSVANADDIITVAKARAHSYICTLSPAKLADVERAIKFALDLP
ncbi:MAG: type II toxin-antitoxin system PemK/MazF family toxin [Dehalococcoidia bacterium]